MRTIIATIIALVSFTMVSCSDADVLVDNVPAQAKSYSQDTRTSAEDAYVRIGMYGNIDGYNLRIENMRVENCLATANFPTFGNEIAKAETLPTTASEAIFDNAEGKYNAVPVCEEGSWIIVHFDVVMTSAGGFESKMRIDDVKYYINPENAIWTAGGHYEYMINLTAEFLGLSSIDFSAGVEDFQNGNNADVNC